MVTPATLKALLPAFASVANDTVQVYLTAVAGDVGSEYGAKRDLATCYLAAHNMTLNGIGGSPEAQFGSFKRLRIGSLELERATSSGDPTRGTLGSTPYGVQFMEIARRVVGVGPVVV